VRVLESDTELRVSDSPALHWVLGLLFIGVGLVAFVAALTPSLGRSAWERPLAGVMGAVAIVTGLWVVRGAPHSSLQLDRARDRLVITRRGIDGRRTIEIRASDVTGVQLVERIDDEGGAIFQIHLTVRDGRVVPVSALWLHGREPMADLARRLSHVFGVSPVPPPA
jgi:hypothetical protein